MRFTADRQGGAHGVSTCWRCSDSWPRQRCYRTWAPQRWPAQLTWTAGVLQRLPQQGSSGFVVTEIRRQPQRRGWSATAGLLISRQVVQCSAGCIRRAQPSVQLRPPLWPPGERAVGARSGFQVIPQRPCAGRTPSLILRRSGPTVNCSPMYLDMAACQRSATSSTGPADLIWKLAANSTRPPRRLWVHLAQAL